MKRALLLSAVLVILGTASLRHGVLAAAKNDSAPGQVKKENQPASNKPDKEEKTNQGQNQQEQTTVKTQAPGLLKKTEQESFQLQSNTRKAEKLGASKLKELLTDTSTGSGKQAPGLLKKVTLTPLASPSAQLKKRHAVQGLISDIAGNTITLVHQIQRTRTATVLTDENTLITGKTADASGSASLTVGMRIAAVGEPTEDGILAKRIHIIPGKATGIFDKQPAASPSSQLTPTPTATESATPTLTPTFTPSPTATATP